MTATLSPIRDPFAAAAGAAAEAIAPLPEFAAVRTRIERLPVYVPRCGDVLADILEDLVGRLEEEHPGLSARLSSLLVEVLLAEEGFSRRFWKSMRSHLKLLRSCGREDESEACLRDVLMLAATLG